MSVKERLEEAKRIPSRFRKVSAIISLSDADTIMDLIEAVEEEEREGLDMGDKVLAALKAVIDGAPTE